MRARDLLPFWLPLFASWLLMLAEGPILTAVLNRLPEAVVMLAALGIVYALSVTIESPIINLLATATALVRDRASYELMRRFTLHWVVLLTALGALLAFTPVYGWVVLDLLGTPPEVARWVRPGLMIMVPWSGAIAWRRFLQGVLIRFGRPRHMAWGTAVRLLASGGGALVLAVTSDLPGIVLATSVLIAGVVAEAIYATWAAAPLLRGPLAPDAPPAPVDDDDGPPTPLTYRRLLTFHLPLAGTTVLILLSQPLIAAGLARLDRPTLTLAAWPVIFQLILVLQSAGFSLPEVVIAKARLSRPDSYDAIRRFAFGLALTVFAFCALLATPPVARFYLFTVQGMPDDVGTLTLVAMPFYAVIPALTVLIGWCAGLLVHRGATGAVNRSMAWNLAIRALVLVIGVSIGGPGLIVAGLALAIGDAVRVVYMLRALRSVLGHSPLRTRVLQPEPQAAET